MIDIGSLLRPEARTCGLGQSIGDPHDPEYQQYNPAHRIGLDDLVEGSDGQGQFAKAIPRRNGKGNSLFPNGVLRIACVGKPQCTEQKAESVIFHESGEEGAELRPLHSITSFKACDQHRRG